MKLGHGPDVFLQAAAALRAWRMFQLGWVQLFEPNTRIEVGATVAVLISHFGFWSLNACRIVYIVEEERRFGFAYGTLQDHAEQGEERFLIEWLAEDDSLWYDILACVLAAKAMASKDRMAAQPHASEEICAGL